MVSGPLAPVFWIGEVGIGMVLPAALLAVGALRSRFGGGAWAVGAAIAALVGVLALRYAFVVAGFSVPLLAGMPAPAYVPSLGEVLVALFVLGLAVGAYGLAVRLLPLERVGASEGEPQVESAYVGALTGKEVRHGSAA